MSTGLENEFTQDQLDDMYDLLMGNEGLTRPDENSGYVTDETGQAYTGYEAMSNEERKQAWDDWYNLADERGYDNLDNGDKLAYIQNGYRLGYLSAEEAESMYQPIMDEMLQADGYVPQGNGVYKKVTEDRQYGQDLEEYRTLGSYTDGDFGDGSWDGGINQEAPGVWSEYHPNNAIAGDYGKQFVGGNFMKKHFNTMFQIAVSAVTGGMAGALAPVLAGAMGISNAAANALASTLLDSAMTLAQGGDLSFKDALISAAGGYLSGGGMDDLLGSDVMGQADNIDGLTDAMSEYSALYEAGKISQEAWDQMNALYDAVASGATSASGALDSILDLVVDAGVEIVWDANNNDGEDAATPTVDEDGNLVFDGSDVTVNIPNYQDPNQTEDGGGGGGGGGGSESGGGDSADGGDANGGAESGGGETGGNETGGDTNNTEGEGQYVVIGEDPTRPGYVVVRDTVDGDIWIVRGDYQIGDIISEDVMADPNSDVIAGDPGFDGEGTNTDNTGGGDTEDGTGTDNSTTTEEVEDLLGNILGGIRNPLLDPEDPNPTPEVTDPNDNTNTGGGDDNTNTGGGDDNTNSSGDGGGTAGVGGLLGNILSGVQGAGDGTGSGDGSGGNEGGGEGEGNGGGNGSGNGNGTGSGSGNGNGNGNGDGDGDGDGTGTGAGGGSPSQAEVKWTDLFDYTTITTPEQSKYAPQLQALSQVRGMMDDLFRNS